MHRRDISTPQRFLCRLECSGIPRDEPSFPLASQDKMHNIRHGIQVWEYLVWYGDTSGESRDPLSTMLDHKGRCIST
jgi:hypothetical protein